MFNRNRFWAIALALMTALSVMGFSLGALISVNAQTEQPTNYQDPAGRFEVALLPEYKVTPVAGMFVVESPDSQIAYTVSVRPKAADAYLADTDLAQFALETVEKGEGFQAGVSEGTDIGVKIPWQGMLGKSPLSGMLFARQTNNTVLILTLSAVEESKDKLAEILPELSQSLKPLA
ncbi:MAG: hypothetical protein WBB82_07235 [Limnothrix sp.]